MSPYPFATLVMLLGMTSDETAKFLTEKFKIKTSGRSVRRWMQTGHVPNDLILDRLSGVWNSFVHPNPQIHPFCGAYVPDSLLRRGKEIRFLRADEEARYARQLEESNAALKAFYEQRDSN
jgi:hypothetical protein